MFVMSIILLEKGDIIPKDIMVSGGDKGVMDAYIIVRPTAEPFKI
jgi:hypothetical protein